MRRRSCLLLAGATLLLTPLALEGLIRLRQYSRYGSTVPSYYYFSTDPETGLRIPKPGHTVGPITVNSLGFRGPEIEQPKPAGRIRIAFLGASTTFCAEATSLEATWPHIVVEGLRAEAPDLDFDYVNGSSGGFTLQQSLLSLEKRVAPLDPDVIVYYEVTNDLTIDTRRLAMKAGLYEPETQGEPKAGWSLTYYLIQKNLLRLFRMKDDGPKLSLEPRELSKEFEQRLRALTQASKARCSVVALGTFSVQMRRDQAPERQRTAAASALYYMPFLTPESLLDGYQEYNRVIREVARESGVILVEGEESIPGDSTHFADSVHFRDPGFALQARRFLAALSAAPEYRALLARRRAGG